MAIDYARWQEELERDRIITEARVKKSWENGVDPRINIEYEYPNTKNIISHFIFHPFKKRYAVESGNHLTGKFEEFYSIKIAKLYAEKNRNVYTNIYDNINGKRVLTICDNGVYFGKSDEIYY